MKKHYTVIGILASIAFIVILLITSIEYAAYGSWKYYEKEYTRLHVLDTVPMTMDDLMDVTHEMMAYLRGNREDLVVETTIDGTRQEFFNDQEKYHMADVRNLFLHGLALRRYTAVVLVLSIAYLIYRKAPLLKILTRCFYGCVAAFALITGILAALFASDFTKYFTIFHEIFFNNDLWIMDPNTSNLINIVPEPFWSAIAFRIVLIFVGALILTLIACLIGNIVWSGKQARRLSASDHE